MRLELLFAVLFTATTADYLYCSNVTLPYVSSCDPVNGVKVLVGFVGPYSAFVTGMWFEHDENGLNQTVDEVCYYKSSVARKVWCNATLYSNKCECINATVNGNYRYLCGGYGLCENVTWVSIDLTPFSPPLVMLRQLLEYSVHGVVTLDPDSIFVSFTTNQTGSLCLFSKGAWTQVVEAIDYNCSIMMPDYIQAVSAYVHVTVYHEGNVGLVFEDWSPGRKTCDILGSWICCDTHTWWCQLLFSNYWWALPAGAVASFCLWYIPLLWLILMYLLWILTIPLITIRWVYQRYTRRQRVDSTIKALRAALIVVFMVTGACACDVGGLVVGNVENCHTVEPGPLTPGHEECSVTFNALVSLPYLNSMGCFDIIDPEGHRVLALEFTYLRDEETVTLETEYYTGPWIGQSVSRHRCFGTPHCKGSKCADLDPNVDINAYGELEGITLDWPGQTACRAGPGGMEVSCFLSDPSCIFSRYALIPKNETVATVYAPVSITHKPHLRVGLTHSAAGGAIGSAYEISQIDSVAYGCNIHIIGSLTRETTIFGSKKFIQVGNKMYHGDACDPNEMIPSAIGDIQSSDPAFPNTPSREAFDYAAGIATPTLGATVTAYSFTPSGFNILDHYPSLPKMIGSSMYATDGSVIRGNNTNPGSLIFTFSTPGPMTVRREINVVCPVVSFLNATGCFSCAEPATIYVRAKSTCQPGSAAVGVSVYGCFDLVTPSVYLTSENKDYAVNIHASCAAVSGKLRFYTATHGADLTFSFTAIGDPNYVPIDNGTNTNSTTDLGGSDRIAWNWKGWIGEKLFDFPNWVDIIITSVGYVAMALAAAGVLYIAISIWSCFRRKVKTH